MVNAFYSSIENSIQFPAGILQGNFFGSDRPAYMNYGGIGWVIGHEITHGFDDQGRQYDSVGNLKNWWRDATKGNPRTTRVCLTLNVSSVINRNHPTRSTPSKIMTLDQFLERSNCIIWQYGNYTAKSVNQTLNGVNTQGENIADNGGIKEAYRAYNSWVGRHGSEGRLPGLEKYSQHQVGRRDKYLSSYQIRKYSVERQTVLKCLKCHKW